MTNHEPKERPLPCRKIAGHFERDVRTVHCWGYPGRPRIWRTLVSAAASIVWLVLLAAVPADAQKILFGSERGGDSEIYVMNADGSAAVNLTVNPGFDGDAEWSPDGTKIVFGSDRDGAYGLFLMNADGTAPVKLQTGLAFRPRWSPDGTKILFGSDRDGNIEIYVMNAGGGAPVNLTMNPGSDFGMGWSPDGTKILFGSDRDGAFDDIFVMNADGSSVVNLTDGNTGGEIRGWSPDGSKILLVVDDDEVYSMSSGGGGLTNLSDHPSRDSQPIWTPDGSKIIFRSDRDGNEDIYVMNADGSAPTRLTTHPANDEFPTVSSDGTRIFFETERDGNGEIYAINIDGSGEARLTNAAGYDGGARPFGDFSGGGGGPSISEGGIVLANLLPNVSTISPLSIISVFGVGFSTETIFFPDLDDDGNVATILGGTCVEIGNERAPIFAITPKQVNVQTPATAALGPVSVVVITDCDTDAQALHAAISLAPADGRALSPLPHAVSSEVAMVTIEAATPGFFLFPPQANDGLIAARFNDGAAAVAPSGMFTDEFGPSRPAKPGDIIVLYGTGWGETEAALGTGELATEAAEVLPGANPLVSFGGLVMGADDVLYVGVTPNAAGLYQLAIRVPATAAPGNNQVVLTVYGKSTPTGPVIPVAAL